MTPSQLCRHAPTQFARRGKSRQIASSEIGFDARTRGRIPSLTVPTAPTQSRLHIRLASRARYPRGCACQRANRAQPTRRSRPGPPAAGPLRSGADVAQQTIRGGGRRRRLSARYKLLGRCFPRSFLCHGSIVRGPSPVAHCLRSVSRNATTGDYFGQHNGAGSWSIRRKTPPLGLPQRSAGLVTKTPPRGPVAFSAVAARPGGPSGDCGKYKM